MKSGYSLKFEPKKSTFSPSTSRKRRHAKACRLKGAGEASKLSAYSDWRVGGVYAYSPQAWQLQVSYRLGGNCRGHTY